MKEKIVLFGSGDIAQIANLYFETDSQYEVVAFTVDRDYIQSDSLWGKPFVPFDEIEVRFPPAQFKMFIALSYTRMNRLREEKYNEAKRKGYKLVSYISSRCSYLTQNPPGDNCFIFEDNTVQPFVTIGNNVFLWSGNHIGHHSEIKDHNFISSHVVISGHCSIESHCFLGVNSTLAHKVVIAEGTLLGAGVIISKDTEPNKVYVAARPSVLEKTSDQIKL